MLTPSHSPIKTIPVDINSSGNNVIAAIPTLPRGFEYGGMFVDTLKLFPDGAVNIIIKAVNVNTSGERILDAGSSVVSDQPFIYENTSPDSVYKFELYKDEELVVELDSAVHCTGYVNVSYYA